jgi:hypothetical protein
MVPPSFGRIAEPHAASSPYWRGSASTAPSTVLRVALMTPQIFALPVAPSVVALQRPSDLAKFIGSEVSSGSDVSHVGASSAVPLQSLSTLSPATSYAPGLISLFVSSQSSA